MKTRKLIVAVSLLAGISACKKDVTKPADPNESELITSCTLSFSDGTKTLDFRFRDPDGEGGNPPVQFDSIKLETNHVYDLKITLLDESKNPVVITSNEIYNERNDHQFFFHPSITGLEIIYNDSDTHQPALPVGLQTRWTTRSASTGQVKVVLKHQPGVKKGDEKDGETDLELNFPIAIR